jgi:hypothetical protein
MTEQEWLTAHRSEDMLSHLGCDVARRKLRLFACASFRRSLRFKEAAGLGNDVALAESYADGQAAFEELSAVPAHPFYIWICGSHGDVAPWAVCNSDLDEAVRVMVDGIAAAAGWDASDEYDKRYARAAEKEREAQTVLVRDIFGNPFRPVAFDRFWVTSNVVNLAQSIYEERQVPSGLFDNQRMGILADALEEAGCDNADILGHLRSGGDHVRGCWAVDLLLGKE